MPCKTFLYTPADDPLVNDIVASIREHNDPPLPPSKVQAMSSRDEVGGGREPSCLLSCSAVGKQLASAKVVMFAE